MFIKNGYWNSRYLLEMLKTQSWRYKERRKYWDHRKWQAVIREWKSRKMGQLIIARKDLQMSPGKLAALI